MSEPKTFTYQCRIGPDAAVEAALAAYAELYGRTERKLFARFAAGGNIDKLKPEFTREFGLTARQYNAISVGLKGKIDSIKEVRSTHIAEFKARIKTAAAKVRKLSLVPKKEKPEDRKKRLFALHHKKRRLAALQARLKALQADHEAGVVRLAFGSKRRFHAQFDLQANGWPSHAAWLADWAARASQFAVLGSKDETAGCQGCVATTAEDGSLALRLRLPDALAQHGKYVEIAGLKFAYGEANILAALASSRKIERKNEKGEVRKTLDGTALSYRFVRDAKGWRVLVSVAVKAPAITTSALLGAIGVDFNADHLAVAEVDRFGNLVSHARFDTRVLGKSTDQAQAIFGDQIKRIVEWARAKKKPVVIERLDFSEKKSQLETVDPQRSRLLSALAYGQFDQMLRAACFRAGVEVRDVHPAYTSVIGAVSHAQRLGISVHLGAALAIARRGLELGERPIAHPSGLLVAPVRNGGHVTFGAPERKRSKHVWALWSQVRSRLRAALRDSHREGQAKRPPPPLPCVLQAVRAKSG